MRRLIHLIIRWSFIFSSAWFCLLNTSCNSPKKVIKGLSDADSSNSDEYTLEPDFEDHSVLSKLEKKISKKSKVKVIISQDKGFDYNSQKSHEILLAVVPQYIGDFEPDEPSSGDSDYVEPLTYSSKTFHLNAAYNYNSKDRLPRGLLKKVNIKKLIKHKNKKFSFKFNTNDFYLYAKAREHTWLCFMLSIDGEIREKAKCVPSIDLARKKFVGKLFLETPKGSKIKIVMK